MNAKRPRPDFFTLIFIILASLILAVFLMFMIFSEKTDGWPLFAVGLPVLALGGLFFLAYTVMDKRMTGNCPSCEKKLHKRNARACLTCGHIWNI